MTSHRLPSDGIYIVLGQKISENAVFTPLEYHSTYDMSSNTGKDNPSGSVFTSPTIVVKNCRETHTE